MAISKARLKIYNDYGLILQVIKAEKIICAKFVPNKDALSQKSQRAPVAQLDRATAF